MKKILAALLVSTSIAVAMGSRGVRSDIESDPVILHTSALYYFYNRSYDFELKQPVQEISGDGYLILDPVHTLTTKPVTVTFAEYNEAARHLKHTMVPYRFEITKADASTKIGCIRESFRVFYEYLVFKHICFNMAEGRDAYSRHDQSAFIPGSDQAKFNILVELANRTQSLNPFTHDIEKTDFERGSVYFNFDHIFPYDHYMNLLPTVFEICWNGDIHHVPTGTLVSDTSQRLAPVGAAYVWMAAKHDYKEFLEMNRNPGGARKIAQSERVVESASESMISCQQAKLKYKLETEVSKRVPGAKEALAEFTKRVAQGKLGKLENIYG